MKKMKNDNKGFTLVEMIVVLVILAILAAILVPALLGYIDEAKNKQLELHGKSVYTAAQAVASKMYAKDWDPADKTTQVGAATTDTPQKYFQDEVAKISEIATFGTSSSIAYVAFKVDASDKHAKYTVAYVVYGEDGNYVKLDAATNGATWEALSSYTAVTAATSTSSADITITGKKTS